MLAEDPSSLISLVLAGSSLPGTAAAPSPLGMPGFGWRLTNAEVAELLTFIRSSWGNHAPSVSAGQVARVRGALDAQSLPKTSDDNEAARNRHALVKNLLAAGVIMRAAHEL